MHLICASGSNYTHMIDNKCNTIAVIKTYKSSTDTIFFITLRRVDSQVQIQTITKNEQLLLQLPQA
jgi:hypothetical protein